MLLRLVPQHDLNPRNVQMAKMRNVKLSPKAGFGWRQFYVFNMRRPNRAIPELIFVVFDDSSTFLRIRISLRRRNDFRHHAAAICDTVCKFALWNLTARRRDQFFSIKTQVIIVFFDEKPHRAQAKRSRRSRARAPYCKLQYICCDVLKVLQPYTHLFCK